MSIIANSKTKIICQGMLTPAGLINVEQAIAYGTNIVGGVAPEKGGQTALNVPLFNTVKEAVQATKPQISVIFASAQKAASEIEEALDAGIKWIVCTTERIPVHDILRIKDKLIKSKSHLIGPASPGLITAGECKVGTMPAHLFLPGNVGIISRSSSVLYEAVQQLKNKGIGVSSCVALGAYPMLGTEFTDILDLFNKDKKTEIVLLIGEIGGSFEQRLAEHYQKLKNKKPLVSYIAGHFVPEQTYMGNIGAIVTNPFETADYKSACLQQAGSVIVSSPATIGDAVFKVLMEPKNE
ncbi:MAG: succinate--CoA ligase subunit alpha [Alphaproteobacteria bacterium]|nr:succinate--CoA ligase subunit alpha [Alphaproteobacteria bacterium]